MWAKKLNCALCALLVFACVIGQSIGDINKIGDELINKKVDRSIDIASQLAKVTTKITVENKGKSPVRSYLYSVESSQLKYLSYVGASKAEGGSEKQALLVKPVKVTEHKDKNFWEIQLPQSLDAGKSVQIVVEAVFAHQLIPHPSHITQSEKQLLLYNGNQYFYSPYQTTTQTTVITTASNNIESYTKVKPVSQTDSTITYGPYENVAPFSQNEIVIHSENNTPFLTVTSLLRTIEVSHWGNVAVEEHIDIRHTGAILKGSFSRYEYQREQNGFSSVRSFKTILPASAADVYYRDEIGNISTSHLRTQEDSVELDLRPRFPLFGGWKTRYTLGYNIPSYEYIYNSGDEFALQIRFVDHIFDDMAIDDATIKIVLPEGAREIKVDAPFTIQREKDETLYSYLDTTGRPTIILHKSNLVESHIQDFKVHYRYQKILMLQEPLLCVLAFYLLFLLVIGYVRLDFSISKNEASESKMKAAGLCEKIQQHQDRLLGIYMKHDDLIAQYKTNKDNASFQSNVKKLHGEQKLEAQAIVDLNSKLKVESSDLNEKVNDMQKLDRQLKECIATQVTQVEKLIGNKVNKQQYLDNEQSTNKKKEDLVEKISSIMESL